MAHSLDQVTLLTNDKTNLTICKPSETNDSWQKKCGILCIKCNKIYTKKINYNRHYSEKHPGLKMVFSCSLCYRTLENYNCFRDHCYRHVNRNRYSCNLCPKTFSNSCYLKSHIEDFHENTLSCKLCSKNYQNQLSLNKHNREVHSDNSVPFEYNCNVCNKKLYSATGYKRHLLSHEPVNTFICDVCGMNFTQKANLTVHLKGHTDKNLYKCVICSKTFPNKTKLEGHLVVHSDVREFVCHICSKAYKTLKSLKDHSKIHNNIKTHICQVCNKGFTTSTKLKDHMNIHTGTKLYKCKFCQYEFANNANCLKHIRKHHNTNKETEKVLNSNVSDNKTSNTKNNGSVTNFSKPVILQLPIILLISGTNVPKSTPEIVEKADSVTLVSNDDSKVPDISKPVIDTISMEEDKKPLTDNGQKLLINENNDIRENHTDPLQMLATPNCLDEEFELTAEYIDEQMDSFDFVPDMPDINIPSLISTLDKDLLCSSNSI